MSVVRISTSSLGHWYSVLRTPGTMFGSRRSITSVSCFYSPSGVTIVSRWCGLDLTNYVLYFSREVNTPSENSPKDKQSGYVKTISGKRKIKKRLK